METGNVFSMTLSIVAVAISIIAIVAEYRIERTDLHASICSEIFDDFLIKRIPKARKQLKFNPNGKLEGWEEFGTELLNLSFEALFYKYDDEDFYESLKSKCWELQDEIVYTSNIACNDEKAQKIFFEDVQIRMGGIYALIDRKRMGKDISWRTRIKRYIATI